MPRTSYAGIFSGGMVGESKMETLKELYATSPEFTAEAVLLEGATFEERLKSLAELCEQPGWKSTFIHVNWTMITAVTCRDETSHLKPPTKTSFIHVNDVRWTLETACDDARLLSRMS